MRANPKICTQHHAFAFEYIQLRSRIGRHDVRQRGRLRRRRPDDISIIDRTDRRIGGCTENFRVRERVRSFVDSSAKFEAVVEPSENMSEPGEEPIVCMRTYQ